MKYLFCYLLFMTTLVAQDKPNVLLIAVHDLNDWIGVLGGHPQAKTPHMDRFAKRVFCALMRIANHQRAPRHGGV